MKKLFIYLSVLTALTSACNNKCIEDIGVQSTIDVSLKPFDQIDVQGAIKLVLLQDSTYRANIQTDSSFLEFVKAEVSGDKLKLSTTREYCGSDSVVVRVGIGELKKLTASGAVQVLTEGKLVLNDLDITLSGSTNARLDLSAGKLRTTADGVTALNLSGQAGSHILNTTGTASLEAFNFIVGVYDIDIDGSGKANINVLNELKTETSGSSEIYYKGNPRKVEEKKSGAAKLEKVN